jgi:transposase
MSAHYGIAILPARPRKPRDKAKVEQAVLIVERWLLAGFGDGSSTVSPTPRSPSS